jgi:hypothetical protein
MPGLIEILQILNLKYGQYMKNFFYPASIAVFGVADNPRNLAKNIILNCQKMGFSGKIYPVGRKPGNVYGIDIIDNPKSLPTPISCQKFLARKSLSLRFASLLSIPLLFGYEIFESPPVLFYL